MNKDSNGEMLHLVVLAVYIIPLKLSLNVFPFIVLISLFCFRRVRIVANSVY